MSLDLAELEAARALHGAVARIVVTGHEGSAPREAGAEMLVWQDGQSGTIGGGALEWRVAQRARTMLVEGGARVERLALGPALGQCCGGAVTLVIEVFQPGDALPLARDGLCARRIEGPQAEPLGVRRLRAAARGGQGVPAARLVDGWLVEPAARPRRALWIWGAGHVGRAVVTVAAPLPDFSITWLDYSLERFPDHVPEHVTPLAAADPAALVDHAPRDGEHLILTYSHALDLELCHRLLRHGFSACGLIGSGSKWARFRGRLRSLGHDDASIARIACPIGDTRLGKHPQAIAVGVVARLLARQDAAQNPAERTG